MSSDIDDRLWSASFPDRTRPNLYANDQPVEGFRPLRDVSDFLVDDLQSLSQSQLYSLTSNNAQVLVAAQQEWIELERLAARLKQREPGVITIKDPQKLPRRDIFEERKEAALYGYKYDAHKRIIPARFTVPDNISDQEKIDCRERQEPFSQSGMIPNDKQFRVMMNNARSEGREKNPDNQKSYTENFALKERPPGTWIAKMLPTNPAPAPRTRAREVALNAATVISDRTTRFGGEKIPPTRVGSVDPSEVASPGKRTATPAGGASPAPKRRKLETADSSDGLPKKKHANQYTKRREEAMAGVLLAAQEYARANNKPVPKHYTQLDVPPPPVSASNSVPASPVPVKKKHPNQYTKRREKEEAERNAREAEERARAIQHEVSGEPSPKPEALPGIVASIQNVPQAESLQQYPPNQPGPGLAPIHAQQLPITLPPLLPPPPHNPALSTLPPPPVVHGYPYGNFLPPPPFHHGYRYPQVPYDPVYSIHNSQHSIPPPPAPPAPAQPPPKPKQPNQWTKLRERQEAERQSAQQAAYMNNPHFHPHAQRPPYEHQYYLPPIGAAVGQQPQNPPPAPRAATPTQPPGRDTSTMTKDEKRKFIFKDHELRAELERDHSWLNDDPEKALAWKSKILHSNYPVRTWAMLRKWREWKHEGKDKRPRDKDGNRIRDTESQSTTNGVTKSGQAAVDNTYGVKASPSESEEPTLSTQPQTGLNTRALSPARRAPRLRTRIPGINSPSAAPSSPLVNGINARELDTIDVYPTASSFTSKLQDMGELDSTSKVDTWQVTTETEYSRSTAAGKGVLRQHPNRRQGPGDPWYNTLTQSDPEASPDKADTGVDSEDPHHGSHASLTPSTDYGDRDTYRGAGTRNARKSLHGTGTAMRRTRSGLSNAMSTNESFDDADFTAPNARSSRKRTGKDLSRTISNSEQNEGTSSPGTRRSKRGATSNPKRPVYAEPDTEESDGESDVESTESPIIGKQSLRPNPPKRTLTGDSEVSALIGTRRSARNTGKAGSDTQGSVTSH